MTVALRCERSEPRRVTLMRRIHLTAIGLCSVMLLALVPSPPPETALTFGVVSPHTITAPVVSETMAIMEQRLRGAHVAGRIRTDGNRIVVVVSKKAEEVAVMT